MTFHSSSGDVFRDLGFTAAESEDLRLRSDLMMELRSEIGARGQSQTEIAHVLGVSQPRVSNLLKGRIDQFSLDALVEMLDRLGKRVDVTIREKAAVTISLTGSTTVQITWPDDLALAFSGASIRTTFQAARRHSKAAGSECPIAA